MKGSTKGCASHVGGRVGRDVCDGNSGVFPKVGTTVLPWSPTRDTTRRDVGEGRQWVRGRGPCRVRTSYESRDADRSWINGSAGPGRA